MGINPVGLFMFDSQTHSHQYLCQNLLSPGSWQQFGEAPMQAGLQLSYTLKRGQLILGVNQAKVQYPDKSGSAIVFSSNFNYPLLGNLDSERLDNLQQLIQNWQEDLKTFRQLLKEKFLPSVSQQTNLFSTLAAV